MPGLFGKARAAVRIGASPALWRIVASELCRTRAAVSRREIELTQLVDDLSDPALTLLEVAGFRYWEPSTIDCRALAQIHAEVFQEDHPHYYEYKECQIRRGDVVIDAGASEGFFTRFALERGARVLAVEPWSVQADALARTFAPEIAEGRAIVHRAALSDREGAAMLEVDPTAPWGATLGRGYRATVTETVPLLTLDRLIDETWGRCDFLKADVEGAEMQLMDGARRTLVRDQPRVAVAVYHGATNFLDVRARLRALRVGYRVTGKGLRRYRFLYVPMLLHAWV